MAETTAISIGSYTSEIAPGPAVGAPLGAFLRPA